MLFSSLAKVVALLALSSQVALAAPHKKHGKKTTKKHVTKTKTTTAAASSGNSSLQQQALSVHNKYRSKHHVAGLRWNQQLADHATKVTKTCVWGHSVMPGTGQNIAYGYPSMTAVIDAWYNEVSDYDYNRGTSKNGKVTGHFTQVVWKGTTEIGCGSTYCANLGGTYYVCDYKAPGNYYGEYTANVFKP